MYQIQVSYPTVTSINQGVDKKGLPFTKITLSQSPREVREVNGSKIEVVIPVEQRITYTIIERPITYLQLWNLSQEYPQFVSSDGAIDYKGLAKHVVDQGRIVPATCDYKVGDVVLGSIIKFTVNPYTINNNGRVVETNVYRAFVPGIVSDQDDVHKALTQVAKNAQKVYAQMANDFTSEVTEVGQFVIQS